MLSKGHALQMVFPVPKRSWSSCAHDILFSTCFAAALRALPFLKSSCSQQLSCGPEALWVPAEPINSHLMSDSERPDDIGQANLLQDSHEPLAPSPSIPYFPHHWVSRRGRGGNTPTMTPMIQSEQSFWKNGPNRNQQVKFPWHLRCEINPRAFCQCYFWF